MSKFKIGDKVYVPYGQGDLGTVVDIRRFLFVPRYVIKSDSYEMFDIVYTYFGWQIARRGSDHVSSKR